MPLCTLHLIQLNRASEQETPFAARRRFLRHLLTNPASTSLDERLLVVTVVRRTVIMATRIDHVRLNRTPWDLMLILRAEATPKEGSTSTLFHLRQHPSLTDLIADEYRLDLGIPGRLVEGYARRTQQLNAEAQAATPLSRAMLQTDPARTVGRYAPRTSQNLELSSDLLQLLDDLDRLGYGDGLVDARGPVQQLNLLSFKLDKADRERYHQYGKQFATVSRPFGGDPKVLASVIDTTGAAKAGEAAPFPATPPRWQEASLVNYHSLSHFAGMAASEAYQSINRSYRLPSLDDTTIICTQEVDLPALRARVRLPTKQANL